MEMPNSNLATRLISQYPDWEGSKVLACLANHPDTDLYASVLELSLQNAIPAAEAENLRYHLAPIRMTDEATLRAIDKRINQLIAVLADANPPLGLANSDLPKSSKSSVSNDSVVSANSEIGSPAVASASDGTSCVPANANSPQQNVARDEDSISQPLDPSTSQPLDLSTPRLLDLQTELSALIAYRKECTLPTGQIKCFNDDDTKAYWRQRNAIRRLLLKAEKDGHHEAVAYVKAHLKMGKIFRWES
jgi:hypothetical protein